MAKKSTSKVPSAGLVDYWFGTVTAAVIIGMSVQMTLSILSSYIPEWLSIGEQGMYGQGGMPTEYLISQLITGVVGVLVGVAFLLIRKPKK